MNIEKMHSVFLAAQANYKKHNIPGLFQAFIQNFTASTSQPNEQTASAFDTSRNTLFVALKEFNSNDPNPSVLKILHETKKNHLVGKGLIDYTNEIIDRNSSNPAKAISECQVLLKEVTEFSQRNDALIAAFQFFKIETDKLDPEEYEVGIILPNKIFDNELEGLDKIIHRLNGHLKTFGHLVSEDYSSLKIRSASSGCFEIFLSAHADLAKTILEVVTDIFSIIGSTYAIKTARQTLKENNLPKATLDMVEQDEKSRIADGLKKITEKVTGEKKLKRKDNPELFQQLDHAIEYLAAIIDEGADIEVSAPVEEVGQASDEDGATKKTTTQEIVTRIHELNNKVGSLNRDKPMLALGHEVEEKEDQQEG